MSRYKFLIVGILGTLYVGFIGDNSIYNRTLLQFEISDLQAEVEHYNNVYENDKKRLRDLERNPHNIERVAREQYFMKAEDEDIFILSSDNTESSQSTHHQNETTE